MPDMRWQLVCERGRQVWEYVAGKPQPDIPYDKKNANSGDKIYRRQALTHYQPHSLTINDHVKYGLPSLPESSLAAQAQQANVSAINYYSYLQDADGHWPGDYGGPMFLLPGALIVCLRDGHPTIVAAVQARRDDKVPAQPPARRRRMGHSHRGALHSIRHRAVLHRAEAARPATSASAAGEAEGFHSASRWRVHGAELVQVLVVCVQHHVVGRVQQCVP